MADRLRVSTRTARSKGYARKNTTPRFTRGWFFFLQKNLNICSGIFIITSSDERASGVVYRFKEAEDHGTNCRRGRDLRQNVKRA